MSFPFRERSIFSMNLKIKPYIKFLLKEHLAYFFLTVLMIVLTIFFIASFFSKTSQTNQKKQDVKGEIADLQTRLNLVNAVGEKNTQDIADDIKLLNTLVPDVEDYFSILYTLENLSMQTNFYITSYIINLKESSSNTLALIISGEGDQEDFLNFLNQYNFAGGRLLTADKIELGSDVGNQIKLNIYAYHQNVSKETRIAKTDAEKLLKIIKPKISIALTQQQEVPTGGEQQEDSQYETKTNPF